MACGSGGGPRGGIVDHSIFFRIYRPHLILQLVYLLAPFFVVMSTYLPHQEFLRTIFHWKNSS